MVELLSVFLIFTSLKVVAATGYLAAHGTERRKLFSRAKSMLNKQPASPEVDDVTYPTRPAPAARPASPLTVLIEEPQSTLQDQELVQAVRNGNKLRKRHQGHTDVSSVQQGVEDATRTAE
jgi:hypothetical protein